jgi:hypothetical protein
LLGPVSSKEIWYPAFEYDVTEQVSAGGIYSNALDLAKFMRFHLKQLLHSDDKVDSSFYEGVFVRPGGVISALGMDIHYRDFGNGLIKFFSKAGALENVRTSLTFSPNLDVGIFVGTNSSLNGFPEGLIVGFLSVLSGASFEEAELVFNQTSKATLKDLISESYALSDKVKGVCVRNASCIAGTYVSNVYMKIKISNDGMIKIGKLSPVDIYKVSKNKYHFLLYNKAQLPFVGFFKILSSGDIELTYYCETGIYKLVK